MFKLRVFGFRVLVLGVELDEDLHLSMVLDYPFAIGMRAVFG